LLSPLFKTAAKTVIIELTTGKPLVIIDVKGTQDKALTFDGKGTCVAKINQLTNHLNNGDSVASLIIKRMVLRSRRWSTNHQGR